MNINTYNLPSKGFNTKVGSLSVDKMTYGDIMKYISDYKADNTIADLLVDIEHVAKHIKGDYQLVCGYDLDALLSIIKFHSYPVDKKYSYKGKEFSLSDVEFDEMPNELKKISKLNDLTVSVPLISSIIKNAENAKDKDLPVIYCQASSYLGLTVEEYFDLGIEYRSSLNYFENLITSRVNIGGEVIGNTITELFLDTIKSFDFNEVKIEYKEDI